MWAVSPCFKLNVNYKNKFSKVKIMTDLSTDELPGHVEDGPVVDHEVPQGPALDPGPHRGVAERLLEEDLVPAPLLAHTPHPRVLVDPGVEEENLGRELAG